MPSQPIQSLVFDYVLTRGSVLMLVLDSDQRIVQSNVFARTVTGRPLTGELFKDVIVDFENRVDPGQLALSPYALHLINMNTHQRQPQTFYCQFLPSGAGVLVLGSLDIAEQEQLRNEILGLNREFSNLTRQLHKANISLEKLNQLKNQFLGMAAHDLRKPVGIVMAYSDFLIDEATDRLSPEHISFLNTIRSSADFMKRLIDNFLDASLIDSGRFDLELNYHDIHGLLNNALKMVSLAAQKKFTRILVENTSPLPPLYLDGSKIEQVLMNIISNAVEYSPTHSTVTVRILTEDHQAVIQVSDQGPGIPESEIQNLFQAYGRTSARKTAGERSIGLGLAISRKIVDQHCGNITVKSQIDSGSLFQVALPMGTSEHPNDAG
jgi:signal transduction histidine kinase